MPWFALCVCHYFWCLKYFNKFIFLQMMFFERWQTSEWQAPSPNLKCYRAQEGWDHIRPRCSEKTFWGRWYLSKALKGCMILAGGDYRNVLQGRQIIPLICQMFCVFSFLVAENLERWETVISCILYYFYSIPLILFERERETSRRSHSNIFEKL